MEDNIEIEFTPEITSDIDKSQISKSTIDFIINYEDGILNKNELKECLKAFIRDEFYNYAESVKRALNCIEIIF